MYNKKMLFMPHLPTPGAGLENDPGRAGFGDILNVRLLCIKWQLFLHCLKKQLKSWFLQLGCHFFSSWYYIESDNICTTGKVLKINSLYTYQENGFVDIVRVTDVLIERGYILCSLFFTSKNKIISVRHTLQKGTYVLWRLMDNEEFDEIMSRRLWSEIENKTEN